MEKTIYNLQNKVRSLILENNGDKAGIPFVTLYHSTTSRMQMPQTNNPYLYVVLDGMLRLYTPEFMPSDVIQAILNLDNELTERIISEKLDENEMSVSDSAVIESVNRLLLVMNQTVPSEFIRKNIMQELIYFVLCGSCGKQFMYCKYSTSR